MKRWLLGAVFATVLAGCASLDLLGPGDSDLEFAARALPPGEFREEPAVQAEGGEGRITVRAQLSTPDPCRRFTAALAGSGAERTLTVTIRRQGEMCVAALGSFEYEATLRDLRPGEYRLRVVHSYPDTGWGARTVLDQRVQVR